MVGKIKILNGWSNCIVVSLQDDGAILAFSFCICNSFSLKPISFWIANSFSFRFNSFLTAMSVSLSPNSFNLNWHSLSFSYWLAWCSSSSSLIFNCDSLSTLLNLSPESESSSTKLSNNMRYILAFFTFSTFYTSIFSCWTSCLNWVFSNKPSSLLKGWAINSLIQNDIIIDSPLGCT